MEAVIESQEVIQQLVRCLADQDLDIAKVAGDVLVTLGNLLIIVYHYWLSWLTTLFYIHI